MKIAIVTTDGETVSQHFGRSPYYKIYTIENKEPQDVEMRERKTGHFARSQSAHAHHNHPASHHDPHAEHGHGVGADRKHANMAEEIDDCQVLVAGGMGRGAYESFQKAGLEVILTDLGEINDVVNHYLNGTLDNRVDERTH